ncbi:AP2-like ethylene-responsive transcription factor At1g79700 [Quercus lobata]|uniref:AP2-like ethylene-responsive transcription factor At1g79700 n=1 Tax=Quercus lobata TaxID=97700 RepID=UPI001244864F|nr:AP2-like ethylene-responsive transcription factor At1g79700 [Quercus lobata]
MVVKNEENVGRLRMCVANGEAEGTRSVKRRRRDTTVAALSNSDDNYNKSDQKQQQLPQSSRFRGVSRHRWTGRFEAHLWGKLSWNITQKKKGKQGRKLFTWGTTTFTNFPVSDYETEIEIMQSVTKEEYLATLRRKSSGFSRGVSKYRGVARHHNNGRWEARIGRVFGNKYLYLATYSTQEEAARAYDIAAIEYRGINAVTNFDLSTYIGWLKPGPNASLATHELQAIPEPHTVTSPSNYNPKEKSISLFLHTNPLVTGYLKSPEKHDIFESKIPVSSINKSSSPTALGRLLRSSVFKELVEKNSNISEDDTDGEEPNNQAQMGSDDDFFGIFYDGIGDIPFVCNSNEDSIELQERGLDFIL